MEISYRSLAQRSSSGVSYIDLEKRCLIERLCKDLAKRPFEEIMCKDLVWRSPTVAILLRCLLKLRGLLKRACRFLNRDVLQRSCQASLIETLCTDLEISDGDTAKIPLLQTRSRNFVNRNLPNLLPEIFTKGPRT